MIALPGGYYNGNRIMANSRYGNRKSDKQLYETLFHKKVYVKNKKLIIVSV